MKKEEKCKDKSDRLYTLHGEKRNQGKPAIINGQKALAYFEGSEIVGYSTLEEITSVFYTKDLPRYELAF